MGVPLTMPLGMVAVVGCTWMQGLQQQRSCAQRHEKRAEGTYTAKNTQLIPLEILASYLNDNFKMI
jgi:hypothetical protein